MNQTRERIGNFFAIAFLAGGVLNLVAFAINRSELGASHRFDPAIILIFAVAVVFRLTACKAKLGFIQPLLFLLMVPFGFDTSPESFYGLGFFVVAVIALHKLQFFSTRPWLKSLALLTYLYGVELFIALEAPVSIRSFYPACVMTLFLIFLFIVYREQIVVYLKEPKPRFSLSERSLSEAERLYVLAILKGKTSQEIAFDYKLSESTVRNTLSRAYKKLGIEEKSGLVALAGKYELVD